MRTDDQRLEELGELVARQNKPTIDALHGRVEQRIANDVPTQSPEKTRWRAAIGLVVAAALILAVTAGLSSFLASNPIDEANTIELSDGSWHRTAEHPTRLRFADGSTLRISPHSSIRTTDLRPAGATVVLENGSVDVDVEHHPDSDWSFVAGPYTVEVTGTAFRLEWSNLEETLLVDMREGSVVVTGPDGLRRSLVDGESVALSARPTTAAALPKPQPVEDVELPKTSFEAVETPGRNQPEERVAAQASERTSWQHLARRGRFAEALSQANAEGFDRLCHSLPVEELYELADVARYAGDSDRAIVAYKAVRERFPNHDLSSRSAFDLGVVTRDHESIDWFEAYRRERPDGPLVREAVGRLLELYIDVGETDSTREIAREYLQKYPDGPHARLARTQLEAEEH